MMLAPTVFGLVVLAGVVAGEVASIPAQKGVRTAPLETRTIGRYLPHPLGGLVAASSLGLGVMLVTTTLMGSADDLGRPGRSLFARCTAQTSVSAGPWPGLFYSVPLGVAVIIGLVGASIALRTVVLRPRSGSDPELVAVDDLLRRRSAEAVVAATGVMVAVSLVGISLASAGALLNVNGRQPLSWTILGVTLLVVAALMLGLACWCLTLLLSGARISRTESGEGAVAGRGAFR
jgi:hypothetical protein